MMTQQWGVHLWGDEFIYREEVEKLTVWCRNNSWILNTAKTEELFVDFRRKKDIQPLCMGGAVWTECRTSVSWESTSWRT